MNANTIALVTEARRIARETPPTPANCADRYAFEAGWRQGHMDRIALLLDEALAHDLQAAS